MLRRCLLLSLLAALALLTAASAKSPSANAAQADGLLTKTLYKGGASGRFLMAGQWYYRADTAGHGAVSVFAGHPAAVALTPVSVPPDWNAKDFSDASFPRCVGWYRKRFHRPTAPKRPSCVV